MKIHHVDIENFTAFRSFSLRCGNGLNVIIGDNGTGKSLFLKACGFLASGMAKGRAVPESGAPFSDFDLFQYWPITVGKSARQIFHQMDVSRDALLSLNNGEASLRLRETMAYGCKLSAGDRLALYLPPKDITENSPGFRSLFEMRYITFDKFHFDLISALCLPPLRREHMPDEYLAALEKITAILGGTPFVEGDDRFYLKTEFGNLDFILVAEGLRKLSLLWFLMRNGSIGKDTVVLWDEPDANMNPMLIKETAAIIAMLAESGSQVFIATHSNFLVNEIDIYRQSGKARFPLRFHAFYRDDANNIAAESSDVLEGITHDRISEAFSDQLKRAYAVVEDD